MLLNIGPKPDGTIPEEQQELLLGIGKWLEINGEAIYGTRPWRIYGEGPTAVKSGSFNEKKDFVYTAKDIRFTTRGGVLYAIVLDWPENNRIRIRTFGDGTVTGNGKIASVQLLGSVDKVNWELDADGLAVVFPVEKPCQHAYALKINFEGGLVP